MKDSKVISLVINGYPLAWRHMGTGAYTRRIIFGLLRHAPNLRFRVLLPEAFLEHADGIPSEVIHLVQGHPPMERSMAKEVYWNNRIGGIAARHFPEAVFHAPRDFWSLYRPKRTMITLHDCTWRFFPKLQGGLIRKWWWRAAESYGRKAELVLTDSEWSRSDLIKLARIPADRCQVLYPWLDDEATQKPTPEAIAALRAKFHLPPRFFLYIGGFNVNKNVEFLVHAYAEAARQAPLPPLVLAGHINDNLKLAVCDVRGAIRETGLMFDQVLTLGFIPEEDLPALLAAADLLVYPSRYEGFGFPPAEAMAVGTPVLAADATSLPEVVRRRECRFTIDNSEELVDKLQRASMDPRAFLCQLPSEFLSRNAIQNYVRMSGITSPAV